MTIFTHRGLDPSNHNFFSESTREAFESQLNRGFGIEFDPCFLADGTLGIVHAKTVGQVEENGDDRELTTLTLQEFKALKPKNGKLMTLEDLLQLLQSHTNRLHALHLKGKFQTQEQLERLFSVLSEYPTVLPSLLLFDVTLNTAQYIKERYPQVLLAPSVAHPYDISRYNTAVHSTLYTPENVKENRTLFDWVWLDEWDLSDLNGQSKRLYTKETFDYLKELGLKISLVTPELHGTSPGLLGGEAHQDAENMDRLMKRIQEIIDLQPDAICTDYPEEVRQMLSR